MGRKKGLSDTNSRADDVLKPHFAATRHPLHFEDLSAGDFERLCLWLAKAEGYKNPEHVGLLGGDDGCDVKAWKTTRKGRGLWWFQCKRRAKVTRKDLIGEVDKIHAHVEASAASKLAGIVFVVAAPVSAATRNCVDRRCAALGYACRWWAKTELDMMVKNHPQILDEFFGFGLSARQITPGRIRPLHQLPSAPPDFTGRERELRLLSESFETGEMGTVISCVRGMAGVGKTALALVAANRMAQEFPGGQIFLDLQGASEQQPLTPGEAMARVIHAFEPALTLPEEVEQLASIYRSVLHDKRVLLFFDNALDADQVRPLIPPQTCWMLVTSRQRFELPGTVAVDLGILPKGQSRRLLRRICRRIAAKADTIAQLCGHLPLALRAAASLLEVRKDISPSQYAQQLTDEQTRLRRIGKEGVELTVEASLTLSYRLLPRKLRQPFCMLSVFRGMIHSLAGANIWQVKTDTALRRLGELLRFSLLDWDEKSQRYRLHELVRLFAAHRLTDANRRLTEPRYCACFAMVLAQAQDRYRRGGKSIREGLLLFDQERTNIEAAHDWVVANGRTDKLLRHVISLYALACAEFFTIRLHPEQRIAWLEPALAAARALGDRAAESSHLAGLGIAYYDWGDPRRAMKYHKRALTLVRKAKSRTLENGALSNLGNCCFLLGNLKGAIRYHERSLHMARQLKDRRGQGKSLGNLGNAYSRMGDKERALEYYQQQLDIAQEIGDREQEGNALNGMGVTFSNCGETEQAIDCYEKSLAIGRELGIKHSEAGALGGLAGVHSALGDMSRAIDFCRQALDMQRLIGDRLGEAKSLSNLAAAHLRLGETERAGKYGHEALAVFRELGNREGEAQVLACLGEMHLGLGDFRGAEGYLKDALPILRELGCASQEAECMGNLGTVYLALGQMDLGTALWEQALLIFQEAKDRCNEARAGCQLSDLYARADKTKLAADHAERALTIAREVGDASTEAACLNNLAQVCHRQGDLDQALDYCRQQLCLARDLGDKRQEADALCGMAIIHDDRGVYERAIDLYREAAELHRQVGDHINQGNDLLNLAKRLGLIGDSQQAVQRAKEALVAFERAASPRAAEVRALLAHLGQRP